MWVWTPNALGHPGGECRISSKTTSVWSPKQKETIAQPLALQAILMTRDTGKLGWLSMSPSGSKPNVLGRLTRQTGFRTKQMNHAARERQVSQIFVKSNSASSVGICSTNLGAHFGAGQADSQNRPVVPQKEGPITKKANVPREAAVL